jgi:hypothetical protein
MAQTHNTNSAKWHFQFRDCDEDDGCIVIEKFLPDAPDDEAPIEDIHMDREAWTDLLLWLQSHE